MRKIVRYNVVHSTDLDDLVQKVESLIDCGWEPFGCLTLASTTASLPLYCQTVVRYAN